MNHAVCALNAWSGPPHHGAACRARQQQSAQQDGAKEHSEPRCHDLRHSFGTQAIPAFNNYEVQRMMGHRHITTTERYLHYAPVPDAAAKLSGLWQSDDPGGNVVSMRSGAA
jgi:integrase